jgi:hypothetical protein
LKLKVLAAGASPERKGPLLVSTPGYQGGPGGAYARREVLPHCEYSEYPCEYSGYRRGPGGAHGIRESCRTVSTQSAHVSTRRTSEGPAVRMADGKSCRTVSTQSTHVSTRGTGEGPAVRMAYGKSCRTVSTQSTPVSTRRTSEGPAVRIADGQSCRTAAQCGGPTHAPPMQGLVYSQYSIAPLNPKPPCRVEYSQRTTCPQRRGHCGSAVHSAPERGNKQNHYPHRRARWHRATSGCNGP